MSTKEWRDANVDKVNGYRLSWYYRNKEKQEAYRVERRRQIAEAVRGMKVCCGTCGEDHEACLEFHHRDPSKKSFTIASMVRDGYSLEKIIAEIAKCDVLCCNCHRKKHYMGLA